MNQVGRMTSNPIRETPFAVWSDPDAWMESMKGPRWKSVLKEEGNLVQSYTQKPEIQSRIGEFILDYKTKNSQNQTIPFECGPAEVEWHTQFSKSWKFRGTTPQHDARDLVATENSVWATEDVGDGAESFQLQCWNSACAEKPAWSFFPVGPELGIVGSTLYYLGVKNKLIYHELWKCDADSGNQKTLVYRETNPMVNLSLEKQPDGRLVFTRENSQELECFQLTENGLKPVAGKIALPGKLSAPLKEYGLDFYWERLGLLVTKQHGKKILWQVKSSGSPKKLLEIPAGQIQVDPYSAWLGKLPCLVRVDTPFQHPVFYRLNFPVGLELLNPVVSTGLKTQRVEAISADGTHVHGIYTYKEFTKPKYLLVTGYGAYGMETATGSAMKRWAPLLEHGWCIGTAFLRGGGDHTEEWAKAGRRSGREKTIDDFKAILKALQKYLHITPKHTAIYGRSAGGLLVGGTLTKNPSGSLMSAVYAEVPYVDELRTTTNTELPLTTLEYNEFGAPGLRLEDFISVGLLSPADSASVTPSPTIFVLTRTAENDSQVFAYESVKWIRRLRDHDSKGDAPKLCIVEQGQGHFTPPEKTIQQWSLDCALLDSWIQGTL
jgi:prolyl oligopeptidase PreP (S9A serine peptidase family)